MATSLTLQNDTSLQQGYIKVNGTTAATITTSGIQANLTGNVTGSLTSGGSLALATAQTASGTSVDFTGIPSWVKRITVMFNGVSTSGASNILIQLGDTEGIEATGYLGASSSFGTSVGTVSFTTGFGVQTGGSGVIIHGAVSIFKTADNVWVCSGVAGRSDASSCIVTGGSKTLSATLDRVRITTVNGTDTFDAGTINISYEG